MSETILESRLIGELFVERGLVTSEQLEQALESQAAHGGRLGEILVAEFGVSRVELASALAEQWAAAERIARSDLPDGPENGSAPVVIDATPVSAIRRPLGEIFLERGLATEEQLEAALAAQRESGGKLGEILVDRGVLSRLDLAGALADQWAGLQKLRPPEPKPIEPWQQVAPREMIEADGGTRVSGDTVALATAVGALEERVRAAESAVASERWRDELRAAADSFTARVSLLEARLDGLAAQDDRSALEAIRATVVELRGQLDEPRQRLAAVETRLADVVSPSDVDERIALGVSDLGARLDTLAERLTEPDRVDEVREAVLVLQRRLDETPALGEELQHGIGAVEERLNGIEERLAAGEARVDEQLARDHSADPNQELRERLEAVERTIADLAVVEAAGASAAVEVGASRLDELASEAIRSPELDALRAELASVQELVAEKLHDRQALDVEHVVDRVADLESRLARLAAATPGGELADRVSDVAQRLDSLAVATARGEDVEALRAELASVRELASASADVSRIDGLAARIEELSGRLDERVSPADLSALAGDLESRLEAGASRDELSELAGDLREQLTSLRFQVDELAAAGRSGARGEDIAALRAELASVRELAARPAGEYPVADELALRLDELGNRLEEHVSLSELSAVAGDLRGELAKTSSRLEGIAVEQAASTAERLSALESRLEEAAASRRTDLATADERIAKRLDGLAADAARGEDVEALRRELQAVSDRSHQTSAEATGPEARLGELAETLAEAIRVSAEARQIASGAAAARTELDARVDALAADAAREWDVVESLRSQLEALEGVTAGERVSMHARVDALQASLAAVAERAASPDQDRVTAIAAGLEALRASLEGRATRHEVSELADSVAEQIARLDDRASRVELTALAGDLRAQLGQLAAQVAGSAAAMESHREASAAALKDATEAFQAQIDARDVALSVEHSTLAAGLQEQIASGAALRASLDELHAASADRDEWRGRVEAGLASRLEGLAASLEETASQVSGLRDENDGRALEIASLQAEIAVSLDELGASLKNELALSERRAEAVDRANATSMASVMDELSRVSDRVVEVEAAATATGHSLAADLERSTGSLAWRLEQVERALADANLSASAQRFEAIEMKLDAGTAIAEEHVRVTERALRKGLATLGERIVEAEDAYAEAGNTLRRSIERLGFAIAEADVRIFERDDPVAAEQHASTAKAHVAFAPTDEGYRLVALDGPPPTIGETVTVNGKSLLCTRLGVSPLPLDPRPCAYLEPLA